MQTGPEPLHHRVRPAAGAPAGALILFHGRGADENDLFPLFDMLDPDRRLVGACPRGPLSQPPGACWYRAARVGYPDAALFLPTFERLSAWLDGFLADHGVGIENTVFGGFSQGAVMSHALAFAAGRPRPKAVMAFSGFIPTVDGFVIDLSRLEGFPVAIGHGTFDPLLEVQWARKARAALEGAGADVFYRESPMPHSIDPDWVAELVPWLEKITAPG